MAFLNATTDIAFKRLFGSQEHTALTISFLNSILERKEGELITEIVINDTANIPITIEKKTSFVDVSCTDQMGKKYIIEMQVINERNFIERSQYYSSFFLARQLEKRDTYERLVPVIFIGVVSFDLFKNSDYLSHHLIMNTKTHEQTLNHLEFHFIELSKFHKTIDELSTVTDKWIFLIQNSDKMEKVPDQFKKPQEMADAMHVLERGYWTEMDLQAYLVELDEWRRKVGFEEAVRREADEMVRRGIEKGIQEGIEKGIQEGIEQGIEKGRREGEFKIVQKMLAAGMSPETIADITGFPLDGIRKQL